MALATPNSTQLAAPGTQYGPCASECPHVECAVMRRRAATLCNLCNHPIGYNQRFFNDAGRLVHTLCWYDCANPHPCAGCGKVITGPAACCSEYCETAGRG